MRLACFGPMTRLTGARSTLEKYLGWWTLAELDAAGAWLDHPLAVVWYGHLTIVKLHGNRWKVLPWFCC